MNLRLSFDRLRVACTARWEEWMGGALQSGDLIFTTNELAGETGEACNVAKKIERTRRGVVGGLELADGKQKLGEELADVVICAQNSALSAGIDLEQALVEKFNKTSAKYGLSTLLSPATLSGCELIAAERARQDEEEGFDDHHDDAHDRGELAMAAASYAAAAGAQVRYKRPSMEDIAPPSQWPWDEEWWKLSADPVRTLTKAGALIAAEIDRIHRERARTQEGGAK